MRKFTALALAAVTGTCLMAAIPATQAQVSVSPMPSRGEKAEPSKRVDKAHFSGNEERDGRGHATGDKH
jgi:hypothetical protein